MNTFENHLECIWLNKSISHFSSTKKEVSQRYLFSYYETRKKSILVNIELYNVDEQIKNLVLCQDLRQLKYLFF